MPRPRGLDVALDPEEEPTMAERTAEMGPGEVVEALAALKEELLQKIAQASERLEIERRMAENPWMVLGLAAGAGFVLGGGVWPTLRPLVKATARWALTPSNVLAIAAAVGAMRSQEEARAEEPTEEPGPVTH